VIAVCVALVAAFAGGAVAATEGALPQPVQAVAHDALGVRGISVPGVTPERCGGNVEIDTPSDDPAVTDGRSDPASPTIPVGAESGHPDANDVPTNGAVDRGSGGGADPATPSPTPDPGGGTTGGPVPTPGATAPTAGPSTPLGPGGGPNAGTPTLPVPPTPAPQGSKDTADQSGKAPQAP
jgi:hypothetical protein